MATVVEKKRSGQEFRWSVRRKTDAVMRLLRGEDLDTVARELRIEAHRLAAWRDEFIAGGAEALKARPTDPTDRKLREAEKMLGEGKTTAEAAKQLGVSEQTFHRWRNQYGGMKGNDVKRLKELEKENSRLKRLVAELSLEKQVLRDVAQGNF